MGKKGCRKLTIDKELHKLDHVQNAVCPRTPERSVSEWSGRHLCTACAQWLSAQQNECPESQPSQSEAGCTRVQQLHCTVAKQCPDPSTTTTALCCDLGGLKWENKQNFRDRFIKIFNFFSPLLPPFRIWQVKP